MNDCNNILISIQSSRSTSNIEIPPGLIHHHLARGAYVIFTGDQSLLQSLNTSGYHVSSTKGSDRASETFLIQQEMIGQLPSSETRPDVLIVSLQGSLAVLVPENPSFAPSRASSITEPNARLPICLKSSSFS